MTSTSNPISLDLVPVCSNLVVPGVVSRTLSGLRLTVGSPRFGNRRQRSKNREQRTEARKQNLEALSANQVSQSFKPSSPFDEHAPCCSVQAEPMSRDHLDTRGAAAYLGLHTNTLEKWRLINAGPSYIRLGLKKVRYDPADLDAWRDAQKTRPGEVRA